MPLWWPTSPLNRCDVPYRDDGGLIDGISENDDVSRLQHRKLTQGERCPVDPGTELERGFLDPLCGGAVCCSVLGGRSRPGRFSSTASRTDGDNKR